MDYGQNSPIQGGGGNIGIQLNPRTGQYEKPTSYNNGNYTFASDATAAAQNKKNPSQIINDIITKGTDAVPAGLKALGSQSTNTLTSSAGVSTPVQGAADKTAGYISDLVGQGNPDYTGQRTAAISQPEQASQDFIMAQLRGGGPGTDAMKGATTQKMDTSGVTKAAGPVDTQKLTDVDMSKYVNPALTAEYDAILHGNDVMNNATRARMAKAGAFGANMDVAQAQNNESTKRQLALAGSDAFKTAQGAAQTDVAAENSGRQSNRSAGMSAASTALGANLTDAQRALTGGSMMNSDANTRATMAATSGANARGIDQAGLDAKYKQYLDKLGYGTQLASSASGALGAIPGTKTLSTEQLGPSAAGAQIGALIGLTGLQQQYDPNNKNPTQWNVSSQQAPPPAGNGYVQPRQV